MGRREKMYMPKSFESIGNSNDTSANIYMSMLLSPAWNNLTKNQQILYVYCKSQYYAEEKKPRPLIKELTDNEINLCFTMNKSKWCKLYKIYADGGQERFKKDMDALINNGFIEIIENGKVKSQPNIYAFSDKWAVRNKEEAEELHDIKNIQPLNKWTVYKHVTPNNKIYYGITSQCIVNKRWDYGRGYIKNKQFYSDIKKYGWNNIKHEIIYKDLSAIEAVCYEYALILRDETYKEKNGYNHDNVQIDKFIGLNIMNDKDYEKLDEILFKIIGKHIKDLQYCYSAKGVKI